MREIFGKKIVPIQYPLSCGPGFNAMIDVLLMKKIFVGSGWWSSHNRRYS